MALVQWFLANWVQVLVGALAIDQALIPIFPKVPFLVSLKNFLMSVKQ